jgi:hypothetical protein
MAPLHPQDMRPRETPQAKDVVGNPPHQRWQAGGLGGAAWGASRALTRGRGGAACHQRTPAIEGRGKLLTPLRPHARNPPLRTASLGRHDALIEIDAAGPPPPVAPGEAIASLRGSRHAEGADSPRREARRLGGHGRDPSFSGFFPCGIHCPNASAVASSSRCPLIGSRFCMNVGHFLW